MYVAGLLEGGIAERRLIDAQYLVDVFRALDSVMRARLQISSVERSGQGGIENSIDKTTLATAARACHRGKAT